MAKVLNSKEVLKKFSGLPKFSDGRIDYSRSREAATVNVFIVCNGKLLLLKRSDKVGNYKRKWNIVAGYFDEPKSIREKAMEEAREEVGLDESLIESLKLFPCKIINDKNIKKIFYVFPILINVKSRPEIKLDWEHTEYQWINPKEISHFKVVHGLENILLRIFSNP